MPCRVRRKYEGVKDRMRGVKFAEHWSQAQLFVNSLSPIERKHLVDAISFELSHCDDPLVYQNAIPRLNDIDHNIAKQIALNVGGPLPENFGRTNHGKKARGLSQLEFKAEKPTIASRRIAILVEDGFDQVVVQTLQAAFKAGLAVPYVIGPRRGAVYPAGQTPGKDKGFMADHHFEGQRSTLFDAVVIPSGVEHAKALAKNGRAVHWIRESFGHLKAIGAIGDGKSFTIYLLLRSVTHSNTVYRCNVPARSRSPTGHLIRPAKLDRCCHLRLRCCDRRQADRSRIVLGWIADFERCKGLFGAIYVGGESAQVLGPRVGRVGIEGCLLMEELKSKLMKRLKSFVERFLVLRECNVSLANMYF